MRKLLLLFLGVYFLLSGCIKNNPNPSWLKINGFTVESNPALTEGNLDMNGFTNGWVYINDKFIGIFELPCKIPVLITGNVSVRVYPTVINNGISNTKKIYPFTDAFETNVTLNMDDTVSVNPVTKYTTGTNFWIEDFEGGNVKLTQGNNSQTSLLVETEDGNRYGKVFVNTSANYWSAYTKENEPFSFSVGSEVYLEFECNNQDRLKTTFIYGKLDGSITEQNNITVTTANSGWKKMYIDLTELIVKSGGYAFWFGFTYELPEGSTESTVLIDNIKVVYK
jgi:hypothetical protein